MGSESKFTSRCFLFGGNMDVPLNLTSTAEPNWAQIGLKTPQERSHNRDECEGQIIAFVKFLARCAAKEDYQFYRGALENPDDK